MLNNTERKQSLFAVTAGVGLTVTLACVALGAMAERLGDRYVFTADWYGYGFGESNPDLNREFQRRLLQHEASTLTTTGGASTKCERQSVTLNGKTEKVGTSCPNMVEIYHNLLSSYLSINE